MTEQDLDQLLDQGFRHHHAGRIEEAKACYEQMLKKEPGHPEALHLLGAACLQLGNANRAIEAIERAIALDPSIGEYYSNLGEAYRRAGRLEEAAQSVRRAIKMRPEFAQGYSNLGDILREMGRLDEALTASRRAVELRPGFAEGHDTLARVYRAMGREKESIGAFRRAVQCQPDEANGHNNLGSALATAKMTDDAVAEYRLAIRLRPEFPEANNNLGCALTDQEKYRDAIAAFRRAIELRGDYFEAYSNLSIALRGNGEFEAAAAAARKALELRPGLVAALNNLGLALSELSRVEEALAALHEAAKLDPKLPQTFCNLGVVLSDAGRDEEAIAQHATAIKLRPEVPEYRWNSAVCRLRVGELPGAWSEYEWRGRMTALIPPRRIPRPRWTGNALNGKTILLHAEPLVGEAIQFVRYVPMVVQRGGRVIVECPADLVGLFSGIPGVERAVGRGQALPEFDVHCPMGSLPLSFATDLNSIPASVPYLNADVALREKWAARLEPRGLRRVGLFWSEWSNVAKNRLRNVGLDQLGPLAEAKDVALYALQPVELRAMNLIDLSSELTDLAQLAGFIANLDLVVTIDAPVAHLAGAMGKPVWVMLPRVADWRWLRDREDSPWYPSVRLFRQAKAGEWGPVVGKIARELSADWKLESR